MAQFRFHDHHRNNSHSGYYIDTQQFTLSQSGEIVDIRTKPLQLLIFFITHSNEVLSKDAILQAVWPEQEVLEQAVFQNVRELRKLFGNGCIKTYSKQGFRWQWPIEKIEASDSRSSVVLPQTSTKPLPELLPSRGASRSLSRKIPFAVATVSFALVFVTAMLFFNGVSFDAQAVNAKDLNHNDLTHSDVMPAETLKTRAKIAILPMQLDDTFEQEHKQEQWLALGVMDVLQQAFTASEQFETIGAEKVLTHVPDQLDPAALRLLQHQLGADFLLYGTLQVKHDKINLFYQLHNAQDVRQGQVAHNGALNLAKQVVLMVSGQVDDGQLIAVESNRLKNARLQLQYQQHPQNFAIIRQLIHSYRQLDDRQNALILSVDLQWMAEAKNDTLAVFNALLTQTEIFIEQRAFSKAKGKLAQLAELLPAVEMPYLKGMFYEQQANFYQQTNHDEEARSSYLLASSLAHQHHCPKDHANNGLDLAALAADYSQNKDSLHYLPRATILANQYRLPLEHYAPIYYKLAAQAEAAGNTEAAIQSYNNIIAVLPTSSLHPMKLAAKIAISRIWQKQHNWPKAIESLTLSEQPIEVPLLRLEYAHILFLQQHWSPSQTIAHQVMEHFHVEGNLPHALSAAVLLSKLADKTDDPELRAYYVDYIEKNGDEYWRDQLL